MTMSRVEVMTSKERRRRWSLEEKRRLVAASLEPGASISEVARSADIHVSQLFRWRKNLCKRSAVKVPQLIPVEVLPPPVAPSTDVEASPSTPRRRKSRGGIIEIELGGERRIRVDSDVDTEALRRVLDALVNR